MSPPNVPLWSICKSSLNVLKMCKSVASRYLTSYAAGKEEHAEVSIKKRSVLGYEPKPHLDMRHVLP